MYFQLTPPSISQIRAKFIIEKLGNISQNFGSINIFATGRTHSGKTTLGNRLLGIDYFLSTGRQDCTKEINLIEFSSGLKYFDLPGVCSDDFLENYNRVGLGIEQFEDFPCVSEISLFKYKENQSPTEQKLTISEYENRGFAPDLIYYLIAPDKQFARGDRKYLRDLLKRHQNVIYVFNMFVNKQTGSSYFATEANIQDVTSQILKVHRNVLGENSKPVIVGVNCLTGEGISELLHQSQQMLAPEKSRVFQTLIEYQQQKTPDEYVRQVKQELIRLYAHSACERATGSDTCDQPLHKICYSLFDFLTSIPLQSEQSDNSITQKVNTIVDQVLSNPSEQNKVESFEEKTYYVQRAIDYILNESIDSFNELIKTYISDKQEQAYKLLNEEFEEREKEKSSYQEKLDSKGSDILSISQDLSGLGQSLTVINQEIDNLTDEYNPKIEDCNSRYIDVTSRRQNLSSRISRWKDRLDRFNENVSRISRSSARLTYEAKQSLDQESNYLDRERNSLQSESSYIESLDKNLEKLSESLDKEIKYIQTKISSRDSQRRIFQEKLTLYNNKLTDYNKFKKNAEDEINFWWELIIAFRNELDPIEEKINVRIKEMNVHVQEIRNRLSENYFEQFTSMEDAISELQEVVNRCIDELSVFENQIFAFQQEINDCMFRLTINKMAVQVLQKTTDHYFDETGDFEYRSSRYNYFRHHGITVLIALNRMILFGLDEDYEAFYSELLTKVERFGHLHANPTESQVLSLLQSKTNLIFDSEFDRLIAQAAS